MKFVIASWNRALALALAAAGALIPNAASADSPPFPAPRVMLAEGDWALAESAARDPALAALYGASGLRPIFEGPAGAARRAALAAGVAAAPTHGLPAARYAHRPGDEADAARALARLVADLTRGAVDPGDTSAFNHRTPAGPGLAAQLRAFLAAPDPAAWLDAAGPSDPRYAALRAALAARPAPVPPGTPAAPAGLFRPGERDPRLPDLRARLAARGFPADPAADPAAADPAADPAVYDPGLAAAIAAFQASAGLTPDGIAGPRTVAALNAEADATTRAILVAMERMRWLNGHDPGAHQVWVNIPAFTAELRQGGRRTWQTRVVVGRADAERQTPEFSDAIRHVVVNPRWTVPRSMIVRDYLPRLQADRHAVAHLDVIDRRGRVIPRDAVDFGRFTARTFPYGLRQKPGDDNALGEVKFIFPNRWNIYLHDTPSRGLFSESVRAHSNGCVRVADPVDLARALLAPQHADPAGVYARARASGKERTLPLDPPIPVHLVYFTLLPDDDGTLRRWPDIYGRDAAVWQALQRAALAPDGESG